MPLWLIRAGRYGEYEKEFLEESRVYLTCEGFVHNLGKLKGREDLLAVLRELYPDAPKGRIINNGARNAS